MREEDIQDILRSMSSFYRDHLPIGSGYERLLKVFLQTYDMIWSEIIYYQSNIRLENAPTLKRIPYYKLDVAAGLYNKDIANRIIHFEFEEQLQYLNNINAFVQLEFDEEETRLPIVYSMELRENFNDENDLEFFTDYFLRDNRIYFMPQYILNLNRQLSVMHAFNIRVDNMMLEKKWGYLYDVETGNFLPRFQYRDVLSSFNRLMQSDLTIRDMKDAIRLATKWDDFDIQDVKSPTLTPARKKMYDDWLISPARFLVILHEDLIKDKIRLNILLSLLDESKEEQITYLIFFALLRHDDLGTQDRYKTDYLYFPKDKLVNEETTKFTHFIEAKDSFNLPHNYDIGRHYDFQLQYDFTGDKNVPLTMDTKGVMMDAAIPMDTPWFFSSDYFELRVVDFPKIPRNLQITKDGDNIIFTFDENQDGTKKYELYGVDVNKQDKLLQTVQATTNETNEIIQDTKLDNMLYYKIRAVASKDKSFFTLLIDKNNL